MNKSKSNLYMKILQLIKPYMPLVVLSLIMSMINVGCILFVPILFGDAIDNIISRNNVDFNFVLKCLLIAVALIIIGAIAQYFVQILSNKIAYKIIQVLRRRAFDKIWKMPLGYIDSHPAGDIISRIITDADQFSDGMLMGFNQLFTGVITILGTLIFMLRLNAYIAIVVVFVTPLSFFVAKFISTHTYQYFSKQSDIRGRQTAQIEEALTQVKVLKAYGGEDNTINRFNEVNEQLQNASLFAIFYSSLTNPCTRFVNSVVYALVALTGALSVISGGMTVGIWSCFLSYANQYTKPFNEITGVITELQGAFACIARIFEFLEEAEEVQDQPDMYEYANVEGNVDIHNVDFSYNSSRSLIENFNLSVKKGQRVAIVGPTGCGKTTIINLLMRFYDPQSGTIVLDGHDVKTASRKSLRSSYGMVLQDTWLRNGTIADNIRIGKPDASMDEIVRAAKETKAHSFIRRLEKGYNTVITEDGGALSAGQKQLLCITRIMLMSSPMLILDEATSSIDTRTEIEIQNAFYKLMKDKTSFVVAHRLSTIVSSDIILVMNAGKIVEQGRHEELLAKGGFYAKLYKAGIEG